jgi:hypothetical protein
LRSKTRRAAGSLYRLEAELSERPLRGGLPVLDCRLFRELAQFRCLAKENRTAAAHHTLRRLCTQVPVFMVWGESPGKME